MSNQLLKRLAVGLVILFAAAQLVRPNRTNPAVDPEQSLDGGGRVPAQVVSILKRSCYDCHSQTSVWPWYTNITPVSWMIANHVRDARAALNFSQWNRLSEKRRLERLETLQKEVMERGMPLPSYLWIHRNAVMSDADIGVLTDWASAETARIGREKAIAAMPAFAPVTSHGGVIYVSGIVPGASIAPPRTVDDIRAQTSRVLDELSARLTSAGSSLDRVLTLSVYLKRAEDFGAMNEVWAKYWPKDPPSRTTIIAGLPSPGALIQVAAVAAAAGTSREVFHPKGWLKSPSPYSYAVKGGDTLYLAGLVARRGIDNTVVKGDITVQTQTALDNAGTILAAAGYSFEDVVSSRVFLTDVADFAKMNDTYRAAWKRDPPARATVITGLMGRDYLVEITLTAVKGGRRVVLTTPNADGSAGKPNPNLSSAIGVGPRLFASGMLGIISGKPPNASDQAKEILARLGRTIAAGGADWANVVDSIVYVTDLGEAPAVLEAFRARRGNALPSGTLVISGLVSTEGRAEIMLTTGK